MSGVALESVPPKKVVLVGHCGPDSSYLRITVSRAVPGIQVLTADDADELKRHLDAGASLLLINRLLDFGFDETEGAALVQNLRQKYPAVKTMLVSNYADAQEQAMRAGALPGFGKKDLKSPAVAERIRSALLAGGH